MKPSTASELSDFCLILATVFLVRILDGIGETHNFIFWILYPVIMILALYGKYYFGKKK